MLRIATPVINKNDYRKMENKFIPDAIEIVGRAIKADNDVAFVGPYHPVTFRFGGYRKGVKPADIEGFDTPILGQKLAPKKK